MKTEKTVRTHPVIRLRHLPLRWLGAAAVGASLVAGLQTRAANCLPPPDGIVAWWPGDGNASDIRGANDGNLVGGTFFATGEVDEAFNFNGTDAYVSVAPSSSTDVGAFGGLTIEAWINTGSSTRAQTITEWRRGGSYGSTFDLFGGNGVLHANLVDTGGSGHTLYSAQRVITANVFHHVAVTYDKGSSVGRLYADGIVVAERNLGVVRPSTAEQLFIGRPSYIRDVGPFLGVIDELSIYSRALSSAEVAAIYAAGSAGKCKLAPATLGEALNATDLTWTTGGAAAWYAQSTTTHDGLWAARSGSISDSRETWMETTVTGPGLLSFWWEVSSESGYDYLEFYINGVRQTARISGEVDWQAQNYTLGTGAQVLRWRYMKDGSASSGRDGGWVDQVTFAPSPPIILVQPGSVTNLPGTTARFSVTVTGAPPLSFQWRLDGTSLADGNRISGTRTNSLTITNVQSQDAGSYTAVVSNPWGSVTSAPAMLRLFSRLTLSVSNQTPASFDFTNAAWVEVTLTAPFPNPFIWYTLDGSPPSPSSTEYTGTFIVSNTVVVRALVINPADFSSVEMAPAAINLWTAFHLFATATAGGTVALVPTNGFYLSNTVVTLTALPEAGWEFLSWTGDASGTSSNVSVVMDRDKSVTAQFGLIPRYTLAVTTVGSGVVSGNTQSNYLRGTTVYLTNAPAAGWEFLSWSGDASGTSSSVSVVMDRNKSVTAQFGRNAFTLTVTTVGGGAVSGNTQSNYFRGTNVNLTAEPDPSWYFQSWSGDASGTSRTVSVVMDRDKSVVANFPPLTLLALTAGGGTIAASPASNFVQDATVVLTAQPQSGWSFLNWMGDASGTNPQASVTMDRPKEVQAVFGTECKTSVFGQGAVVRNFGTGLVRFGGVVRLTAIPQPGYYLGLWGIAASSDINPLDFTVTNATPTVGALFAALGANQATLTVREQGAGVVAREPQANAYTKGQAVRLTAQPFPGQAFLGWTGDASGTQNPLTVTVTTNQTITATFTHRLGLAIQPWLGPTQRRGFLFLLAGDEGDTCLVQTSPDLADWQPLTTLTISNTAVQFIDVAVTNHSPRFYRGVLP